MKHALIRLVCVLLALTLMMSSAMAYNKLKKGSKGIEVMTMQEALKGLGYDIAVDGSYGNATVNVVKTFQKTYGLTVDGVAGNKTLTLLYSLASAASATPAPAASGTVPAGANTAVVTTTGGSLNFRAKASTASNVVVLAYIPNGTRIEVTSVGSTWCQAVYNGKTGYVMTQYLTFDHPQATATAIPLITAAPDMSYGLSYATVKTSQGGSLNLRATASTGNNIVTTIPNGARLTVTARGNSWCAVQYGNVTGYVMTQYLIFDGAVATPTPTPVPVPTATPVPSSGGTVAYVTTANGKSLNLRSTANSNLNNVIATIPNGTQLLVT
ncbi:MAG: SH3 domain-containing protein, partial [Clostridia bacterium]|nr:SH3 domain-containing protein [Clostridia bacterium]